MGRGIMMRGGRAVAGVEGKNSPVESVLKP